MSFELKFEKSFVLDEGASTTPVEVQPNPERSLAGALSAAFSSRREALSTVVHDPEALKALVKTTVSLASVASAILELAEDYQRSAENGGLNPVQVPLSAAIAAEISSRLRSPDFKYGLKVCAYIFTGDESYYKHVKENASILNEAADKF